MRTREARALRRHAFGSRTDRAPRGRGSTSTTSRETAASCSTATAGSALRAAGRRERRARASWMDDVSSAPLERRTSRRLRRVGGGRGRQRCDLSPGDGRVGGGSPRRRPRTGSFSRRPLGPVAALPFSEISCCCRRDPASRDARRTGASRPRLAAGSSPTGSESCFRAAGTGAAAALRPESRRRRAAGRFLLMECSMRFAAISPDGRFVAAQGPDSKIAIHAVDRSAPRPLRAPRPARARFSGAPTAIALRLQSERTPARVFKVDIETGRRELWKTFAPADRSGWSRSTTS